MLEEGWAGRRFDKSKVSVDRGLSVNDRSLEGLDTVPGDIITIPPAISGG